MRKIKVGSVYTKKELKDLGLVPMNSSSDSVILYKKSNKVYIIRQINQTKFRITSKYIEE